MSTGFFAISIPVARQATTNQTAKARVIWEPSK
jgi:hypothetical protein